MDSRIDDVFCVPEDGHILNDGEASLDLPTYRTLLSSFSPDSPLTLTDCYLAIWKIIRQARFIGFEIARKQMPFFKRTSRKIVLQGDPREFDIMLGKIAHQLPGALNLRSIQTLDESGSRLADVLKTLVKAHDDFGASSGIWLLILKLC